MRGPVGLVARVLARCSARCVGLVLVVAAIADADISVNVPLDHWSYGFVERFEAKGVLKGLADGIKPFSRQRMAQALLTIDRRSADRLTAVEADQLERLLLEFEAEVERLEGGERGERERDRSPVRAALARARSGGPLVSYRHDDGELRADLLVRQQSDWFTGRGRAATESVYRNRIGGVVSGHMGGKLGYRIAFEQTQEHGSRTYVQRGDVYERRLEIPQLKGNRADYHEGTAYVVLGVHFLDVEIGKDEVRWGPAPGENLGLSNAAPSFDMVRLRARLGAFELVSIAGALRPCPDRPDSPTCAGVGDTAETYVVNGVTRAMDRDKYLAAHRLEVAATPWLDVGFQEVLVYGDRGPSFTYLNPIMFYWAAQSYQGDKDNLMMGLDVDLHGRGKRFYFAYVVDDLKKLRIFSDDFANKFALQTGVLFVDPLGVDDTDVRLEYVRIEPWIYTHKFPINTFRHFDAPLGHRLGPNSDRWQAGLGHRFHRDWAVELQLGRSRHGRNETLEDGSILNVGGDLHLGSRAGDNREDKEFLDGSVERRTDVGGSLSLRPWTQLSVTAAYSHEWGENVPLPPRWGEGVALQNRTGFGDGNQHRFSLELRYGHL